MRKIIAFIMTFCLILTSGSISFSAKAEGKITQGAILDVISKYNLAGPYTYWTYDSTVKGASTAWTGSSHASNSTSSGQWRQYGNEFFGGIQCWGFAEFMGWAVTGGSTYYDVPYRSNNWAKYWSKDAYLAAGGLAIGDIIHYNGHSVMIYEVVGNGKFKVVEALGSVGNKINCCGWVEGYESHSTLSYFDSYKGAWQYALKYKGNIQPETYTKLEFRDVVYPKIFKIDTRNGWFLQGGTVVSNADLTTIQSIITRLSDNKEIDNTGELSVSRFTNSKRSFATKLIDTYVKFSNINTAGKYAWIIIAKDSAGKELRVVMEFDAVTSGSTSIGTRSISNSDPWPTPEPIPEFKPSGNTSAKKVYYVNSSASNSSIDLISEMGNVSVNQHVLGVPSGTGIESHHGFYLVAVTGLDSQYRTDLVWAPSATTNTSGISTSTKLTLSFPSIGCFIVEVTPLSSSQAAKYWVMDSIDHWIAPAKWYLANSKNISVVTASEPAAIDFNPSGGVPSGTLPKGEPYELRGIVSSKANITVIEATVYDARTNKVVTNIGSNPIMITPNSTSVDIYTSKINTSLIFNQLPDGQYRYMLFAANASGRSRVIANSTFTIGNAGGVRGDADGNGVFDFDDILLMVNYYCGLNVNIVASNCDLDGNGKACDFDDILAAIDLYCK